MGCLPLSNDFCQSWGTSLGAGAMALLLSKWEAWAEPTCSKNALTSADKDGLLEFSQSIVGKFGGWKSLVDSW